jgi:hypothetical protein
MDTKFRGEVKHDKLIYDNSHGISMDSGFTLIRCDDDRHARKLDQRSDRFGGKYRQ